MKDTGAVFSKSIMKDASSRELFRETDAKIGRAGCWSVVPSFWKMIELACAVVILRLAGCACPGRKEAHPISTQEFATVNLTEIYDV